MLNTLYLHNESFNACIKRFIYHHLEQTMESILKITYCADDFNLNRWRDDAIDSIKHLQSIIAVGNDKYDSGMVIFAEKLIDDAYANAVKNYKELADLYFELRRNLPSIPDQCPWALEDFVTIAPEATIKLVLKLPRPDDFDHGVYMKLFPACVDNWFLHNRNRIYADYSADICRDCKNHDRCLEELDDLVKKIQDTERGGE